MPNITTFFSTKKSSQTKSAFSLIELSVVILIVGILVIGVTKGKKVLDGAKLASARSLTISSPVVSMENLVLWLDATDNSTIATGTVGIKTYGAPSDNSFVTDWKDKNPTSTSTYAVSAIADTNRPKYIQSGIDGLPTLQFDGTDDYLRNINGIISDGKDGYTAIAVFKANDIRQALIFSQGDCAPNGSAAGIYMEFGSAGSWGCGTGYYTAPYKASVPYVVVVRINKTQTNTDTIYLNNYTSAGSQPYVQLKSGAIAVGNGANSQFFKGYISEIVVFDRALTNAEITTIQQYLSGKYGIKL